MKVDELEFDASRQVPRVRAASWRGAQTGDDGDFAETLAEWARTTLSTTIEIVHQSTDQKGFSVIAAQVAVEWKLAWLIGYRWLARDYEPHLATSEAFIRWASPYRSSCSGRSCGATPLRPCYLKISNTFRGMRRAHSPLG
ncbi:hypothetical protein [Kutzneria sp. 744]|uniref:hypothetical protein n=1 Tax=Kutzneria sp. (strain 744) TaxID=345341 RepID=UPI0003EEE0C6|nr:hypothetical protein [Kutzneria sp. 744]EWM15243.1 transposase [Kutzneria sp. 744]